MSRTVTHQVHATTRKIIRVVEIQSVVGMIATVKAVNGPLAGCVYEMPVVNLQTRTTP